MKEHIEKILTVVGYVFITIGIVAGGYAYSTIDKAAYNYAKQAFEDLPDNQAAEAAFNVAHQIYLAEVTYSLSVLFGGIISGLLFIGFAQIIELLKEKNDRAYHMAQMINKIDSRLAEMKKM